MSRTVSFQKRRCWLKGLRAILLSTVVLPFCVIAQAQSAAPIRIAAAADLQPVLPPILAEFERETGRHAEASYASSATLATQIENGAPFDLFLSADMGFAERVTGAGFAAPGAQPAPYASGTLVLWTRSGSGVTQLSMDALRSPAIHTIAIANPEHAPYGRAAMQALTSLHLLPEVQPKLRTAENIGQAAQFASTGNTDVGLISLTSARKLGSAGHFVPVPRDAYQPLLQGAIVLKGGAAAQGGAAFLKFLHSVPVAEQLKQGGLMPVQ